MLKNKTLMSQVSDDLSGKMEELNNVVVDPDSASAGLVAGPHRGIPHPSPLASRENRQSSRAGESTAEIRVREPGRVVGELASRVKRGKHGFEHDETHRPNGGSCWYGCMAAGVD